MTRNQILKKLDKILMTEPKDDAHAEKLADEQAILAEKLVECDNKENEKSQTKLTKLADK